MPMTQAQIDALLKKGADPAPPAASNAEKRNSERREYRGIVYIGLSADASLDENQLFPAASVDVSGSGLAFRWPYELTHTDITVLLMIAQQPRGMRAEVVHSQKFGDGFIVGCRFTGTIK